MGILPTENGRLLVSEMQFLSGTCAPGSPLKLPGAQAHPVLEGAVEVALIGEADAEGDLTQRGFRGRKQMTGILHTEPAHVLSDRAVMMLTEAAHEVCRVDAHGRGDHLCGQTPGEVSVEKIGCLSEPAGSLL